MKSENKYEHTLAREEIEHLKVMGKKAEANKISSTEHRTESETKTRSKKLLDKLKGWKLSVFLILLVGASADIQAQSPDSIAVNLDGSSGTISILHDDALMPSSAMTIEAWIYADDISSNQFSEIYRKEDGNNRQLFSFQEYGTILSFGINTGGSYAELDAPIDTADFEGKWVHVAATYDGSFKRIYVNGIVIDSVAASGSLPAAGSATSFIGSSTGFVEFFDGKIDEFRFWSQARTKKELSESKDQRLSGGEPGLELYLPFDENSGVITADISVNLLTATFTGGVTWSSGIISSFKNGSGTAADPYQIATVEELQTVRSFLGNHFVIMNNIDASPTSTWFNGAGFKPIGERLNRFQGSFNGAHFDIDGLTINRVNTDYVGLFGVIDENRPVSNVHLTNANITGNDFTGGIAGLNIGHITSSSVVGNITGRSRVGGIVGETGVGLESGVTNMKLRYSYARGTVDGESHVGGAIGVSSGFNNVFSIYSSVTNSNGDIIPVLAVDNAPTDAIRTHAVNSYNSVADYTNLFYDFTYTWHLRGNLNGGYPVHKVRVDSGSVPIAENVQISGELIASKTLSSSYTYSDPDTDFETGTSWKWYRSDDENGTNKSLIIEANSSEYTPSSVDVDKFITVEITPKDGFKIGTPEESLPKGPIKVPFTKGTGVENDPFQVTSLIELQAVAAFTSSYFLLMNDIDATETSGWNNGQGFNPIGSDANKFSGSFNGQEKCIEGLVINTPDFSGRGFFGVIDSGGIILNLCLKGGNIVGSSIVGAIAGLNNGLIKNSYSSTSINGSSGGGLVGVNYGLIEDSHSTGNVSGGGTMGGLVGSNPGTIKKSFATGNVSGNGQAVGGLVGYSAGIIEKSFSRGNAASSGSGGFFDRSGGLVGGVAGTVSQSYSTGTASGIGSKGGLTASLGLFSKTGIVNSSFWDTQTSGQSTSEAGTGKTTSEMKDISTFTAAGWDFNTVWAIDPNVNDGYPFLQEQRGNSHIISGNEGWRMMASPVSGASFSTLLDGLWTQGFTGASTTSGSSNIYFWDEPSQSFVAPTSAAQVPAPGQGFIMYMFADDDNDGTPEGFPKSLSNDSIQVSGQLAPTLSFTDTDSMEADGWNLVGNPYGTTINWNAPNGWNKANLDQTIYVWSDSASGGAGAYKSWNGNTGTLGSGKIAPWQGFWVKANAAGPSITFTDSVRNTGGVFLKKAPKPEIKLRLSTTSVPSAGGEQGVGHSGLHSTAIISFQQGASKDKDPLDAYKLQSLNGEYLSLGTSLNGEAVMDIQALPFDLQETELELDIRGSELAGEFTLSWNPKSIPEDWIVTLVDRETGKEYKVNEEGNLKFEIAVKAKVIQSESDGSAKLTKGSQSEVQILRENPQDDHIQKLSFPNSPIHVLQKSKAVSARFVLKIKTGTTVSTGLEDDLPTQVQLSQNYPNPFNPSTTINYGVPQKGQVVLEVFNLLGQKVASLVNTNQNAGRYSVTFDASNLSSGLYFYRLQTGGNVLTEKMLLVK